MKTKSEGNNTARMEAGRTKTGNSKKKVKSSYMNSKGNLLRVVVFIALLLIVFYPPYLRGLFFEAEQTVTAIFIFILFLVFWIYKYINRDGRFLRTPLDYASFGFIIVYTISLFTAVGLRYAIIEWLKYCMYFAVFFMLSELTANYRSKLPVLWTIIASGAGVSLIGIDGAAGGHGSAVLNNVFKFLGAGHEVFFDLFRYNRIYSTLQYPNTLAAYLMAVYFVSLAVILTVPKLWQKALAGAASFVVLITFVFTLSRGAYLILPFAAVIFLIFLPKGTRVRGVAFAAASVLATGIVSVKFAAYVNSPAGNELKMWILAAGGIVVSAGLTLLSAVTVKWLEKVHWKVYAAIAAVFAVMVAAGTIYALNATVPLQLQHPAGQKQGVLSSVKSVVLKPEMDVKLVLDVNASMEKDQPNAFSVTILSRSENNILFGGNSTVTSYSDKGTNGVEKREISFKVPADSKVIDFKFANTYEGTGAIFDHAVLVDGITGKTIESIPLKYRYLPEMITSRLDELQVSQSALLRNIFYRDGLKIFKDRWLTGGGGGAWKLLYSSYQSYYYQSTQAHTHFLQVSVETGILGLIVFCFLIFSLVIVVLLIFRRTRAEDRPNERMVQAGLATAIAVLLAHSFMDFDFTYLSVFLLFWELAALLNADYRNLLETAADDKKSVMSAVYKVLKPSRVNPAVLCVITGVILLIPVLFITAGSYSGVVSQAVKQKDLNKAIANLRTAASLDPFKPEYRVDYANLLVRKKGVTQTEVEEANRQIKTAEDLGKYDLKLLPNIGSYYLVTQDYENGLRIFDRQVELGPYNTVNWQKKTDAYFNTTMGYFSKNDNATAKTYIDQALAIAEEAAEVNKNNMNPFVFNTQTSTMLEWLKYIKDKIDVEKKIDIGKIAFYLLPDMDVNSDGIPDQWTKGNQENIAIRQENGGMTVENTDAKKQGYIESRELSLLAGKNYKIEMGLADMTGIQSIPFMITGVNAKNELLKPENGLFTAVVKLPRDFKPNKNVLRVFVNGKYTVKTLTIEEIK